MNAVVHRGWNIVKGRLQDNINNKNRKRLKNPDVTIIASNCTGGFLYHWLGLEFKSPFINLYLTPTDFLTAMENFDLFMTTPIVEMHNSGHNYPVGIGALDTRIHFMHYPSFDVAVNTWNKRKARMRKDNMCIFLSNWGGGDVQQLERFDRLPFPWKKVFTDKEYPEIQSAFCLKGFDCKNGKNGNIYNTQYINGKRYIDQFDYVDFFNRMIGCEE